MKTLNEIVVRFRIALETEYVKNMYLPFTHFPQGSCNDASILLGVCLQEMGFGTFHVIYGRNKKGQTHSWLEQNKLLIDITADQFSSINKWILFKTVNKAGYSHLGFVEYNRQHVKLQLATGLEYPNFVRACEYVMDLVSSWSVKL